MVACAILTLAPTAAAQTVVLRVDDGAALGGDGLDWSTPFRHVQDALQVAHGDTGNSYEIRIAGGTFYPDLSENDSSIVEFDRSESFNVTRNNLIIRGGYAGIGAGNPDAQDSSLYVTRLSGDLGDTQDPDGNDEPDFVNRSDNSYQVIKTSGLNSSVVFDGFTISGGYVTPADVPNLTNTLCPLASSIPGASGGGMQNIGSSPRVLWCTFEDNLSNAGGGMANVIGSSPIIANCIFQDNYSTHNGGGIFDRCYSSPTVVNCKFLRNSAEHTGGGFHIRDADIETPPAEQVFIVNCLFIENSADDYGGGIRIGYDADATIANCTFVGNVGGHGGGIAGGRDTAGATGHVLVSNCVLWGNTTGPTGVGPQIALIGGNAIEMTISYSDIQDRLTGGVHNEFGELDELWGDGNIDEDPLFVSSTDYHLDTGSPCINAGTNAPIDDADDFPDDTADLDGDSNDEEAVPLDLDNQSRFCNQQKVDMGAYESQTHECPADIAPLPGGDGCVGVPDLLAVISGWGPCPAIPGSCNGNVSSDCGDTTVGTLDLLAIINNWGPCDGRSCESGHPASAPAEVIDCMQMCAEAEDYAFCVTKCLCGIGYGEGCN